jgi:DNA-binding NtrC family response regulator
MARILISEADRDVRRLLTVLARRLGHEPVLLEEDLDLPPHGDLLLVDPTSATALERARRVRRAQPDIPVICMNCVGEHGRFLLEGASDYLPKPFTVDQMRDRVAQALASPL